MRQHDAVAVLSILFASAAIAPPNLVSQQAADAPGTPAEFSAIPSSLGQPERPRGRWGALAGYSWERDTRSSTGPTRLTGERTLFPARGAAGTPIT